MLREALVLFSVFCLVSSNTFQCFSGSTGQTYDWLYQYDTGITFNQVGFNPYKDGSVVGKAAINIPNYGGANGGDGASRTLFSNLFTRSNYLSARMTGVYTATSTQTFNTTVRCDDGCRWWIDGKLHVDIWKSSDIFFETETWRLFNAVAGKNYTFSFEWFETTSKEGFQLLSSPAGLSDDIRPCIPVPTYKSTTCDLAPRGLNAEFFDGSVEFTGTPAASFPVTSTDILNLNVNSGAYPFGTSLGTFSWGIRYTGLFVPPSSGDYYFWATKIEYTRVSIGGVVVLEFGSHRESAYRKGGPFIRLLGGKGYEIEVLFRNIADAPSSGAAIMQWGFTDGTTSTNFAPSMLRACKPYAVVAPEVVIVNTFEVTAIPVVLSLPPTGPVNVTFTLEEGVTVSPCILYFTPDNWNVTQYIYAKTTTTNRRIYYNATGYEYTGVESTPTLLTYTATVTGTRTCTSWGDPHFITFSGTKFDFFGVGAYYLYRSLDSSFVVQAQHYACGKASCNGGFALKYYDAVAYVYLNPNGIPSYYATANINLVVGYTYTTLSNGFELQFPNGIKAEITSHYWTTGKIYYLNIDLTVPQAMDGTVRGLCGTMDSNKANDYVLPDGTITTLNTFTDSWLVPTSENLFENGTVTITKLPGAPNTGIPTTILTNCSVPIPPPITPPIDPPPNITTCDQPISLEEAEAYCLTLFNTSTRAVNCAKQGVDTNTLYTNCVNDVYLLCDEGAAIPAYDEMGKNCTTPEECPGECLGRGECQSGKCVCEPGYVEPNCSPFQCPSTFSIAPSSGGPGAKVYLTGSAFSSGTVYTCHFSGNVDVVAVVVDDNTAYCITPDDAQGAVVPVSLVKDGKDCSDNPPTFTYTSGNTNYSVVSNSSVCASEYEPAKVFVHLSTRPSTTVTVTLQVTTGLTVSVCSLTFTPSNWNIPQYYYAHATQAGKVTYIANGGEYTGVVSPTTSICLTSLTQTPYRTCTSWGDPHLISFSGKQYDVQNVGNFYMYKTQDSSFVVQSNHYQCAPSVSCNYAIAVRYLGAVFIMSLSESPYFLYQSPLLAEISGFSFVHETQYKRVILTYPNGITVVIKKALWPKKTIPYLNVDITAPFYMEQSQYSQALCGTQDANKLNDFVARNGSTLDVVSFVDSWAVPEGEDLFVSDTAVIPSSAPYPTGPYSNCDGPLPTPGSRPTPTAPTGPTTSTSPCDLTTEDIAKFCEDNFLDAACVDNSFDLQTLYDNCVNDVTAACDYTAASSAYDALSQNCNPDGKDCPGNCNFQGTCVDGACQCNAGFNPPLCDPSDCPSGYTGDIDGKCVDDDECALGTDNCHSSAVCSNTLGSFTCACLPGYSGDGVTSCSPDAGTNLITPWRPIARFLFNGNTIDSSGNNRTIAIGGSTFQNFYMRQVPTNQAIFPNKNELITSLLPLDKTITIAIMVHIQAFNNAFDLIQLKANPAETDATALLTVSVLPTGKLTWKSKGVLLGTSYRYLLTGRTYFIVVGLRGDKVFNFIENVQIGTFNLVTPPTQYFLRLSTGKNLLGWIDEVSVYDEPVFGNTYYSLSSLVRCRPEENGGCASTNNRCYNTPAEDVCGELLIRYSNNP